MSAATDGRLDTCRCHGARCARSFEQASSDRNNWTKACASLFLSFFAFSTPTKKKWKKEIKKNPAICASAKATRLYRQLDRRVAKFGRCLPPTRSTAATGCWSPLFYFFLATVCWLSTVQDICLFFPPFLLLLLLLVRLLSYCLSKTHTHTKKEKRRRPGRFLPFFLTI